jgi:hypothetical protein
MTKSSQSTDVGLPKAGWVAWVLVLSEPILFLVLLAEIRSPALGLALRDIPTFAIFACSVVASILGLVAFSQSKRRAWVLFSISSLLLPLFFGALFAIALGVPG